MIEVLGPLWPGGYAMPYATISGQKPAGVDMTGNSADLIVEADSRKTINFPVLYEDFKICWRDVEADRHLGIPLDVNTTAVAAGDVTFQEDQLAFNDYKDLGLKGLLNVDGCLKVKIGDWKEGGVPLADTVKDVSALGEAGNYGPFSMAVNPMLEGQMARNYGSTGMLKLNRIKALHRGNDYPSSVIGTIE